MKKNKRTSKKPSHPSWDEATGEELKSLRKRLGAYQEMLRDEKARVAALRRSLEASDKAIKVLKQQQNQFGYYVPANVLIAIKTELDHQRARWPDHKHTIPEWILIIEKVLRDAKTAWYRSSRLLEPSLHEMRQIAACAIAAMIQCGAVDRPTKVSTKGMNAEDVVSYGMANVSCPAAIGDLLCTRVKGHKGYHSDGEGTQWNQAAAERDAEMKKEIRKAKQELSGIVNKRPAQPLAWCHCAKPRFGLGGYCKNCDGKQFIED